MENHILCPSTTAICLLPALGKEYLTSSIMLLGPGYSVEAYFISKVGTNGNFRFIHLPDNQIPPSLEIINDMPDHLNTTPQCPLVEVTIESRKS